MTGEAIKKNRRGVFISFDGCDGAGKSTQVLALTKSLREKGLNVIQTREMGGTPAAEAARKIFLEYPWLGKEGLLIQFAARSNHVNSLIKPALERGDWVVSDRFYDATIAYQCYGQGASLKELNQIRRFAIGNFKPDLTLIFDLDSQEGINRIITSRGGASDRFEQENREFFGRVTRGFTEIAKAEPKRCVLIDASGTIPEVQQRVWHAVEPRLQRWQKMRGPKA